MEHTCEIILNLDQWIGRCRLKGFFSFFSCGGHFALWSGTFCAILVEDIMGNIHVKLFLSSEDISCGGHFASWSGTFCAILVEGIMRNIHVKLF